MGNMNYRAHLGASLMNFNNNCAVTHPPAQVHRVAIKMNNRSCAGEREAAFSNKYNFTWCLQLLSISRVHDIEIFRNYKIKRQMIYRI